MPSIAPDNGVVTQITTVALEPAQHEEALALMKERARFMASQPGFVSIREQLAAAHHAPEFRDKWPRFGELIKDAEPSLYDVVLAEGR